MEKQPYIRSQYTHRVGFSRRLDIWKCSTCNFILLNNRVTCSHCGEKRYQHPRLDYKGNNHYPLNYASMGSWNDKLEITVLREESLGFSKVPNIVFLECILPLLYNYDSENILPKINSNDIRIFSRCSQVCREWKDYFSQNEFWKYLYLRQRVSIFYEKRIHKLSTTKMKKSKCSSWSNQERNQNKCTMVVVNNTENIPFELYWIKTIHNESDNSYCTTPRFQKTILPGRSFSQITYPEHRFVCFPSKKWLFSTFVSSMGFTFKINVFDLKNYTLSSGTSKPVSLTIINELDASKYKMIKNIQKEYPNYKHQIMNILLNRNSILTQKNINQLNLQRYKRQSEYHKAQISDIKASALVSKKNLIYNCYLLTIVKD